MEIEKNQWTKSKGWQSPNGKMDKSKADLVLYFGGREELKNGDTYRDLKAFYPNAHIVGCSTGGEIYEDEVYDETVVAIAVRFKSTQIKVEVAQTSSHDNAFDAGSKIGTALKGDKLAGIFVLSEGTTVNGSDLVRGIISVIGNDVPITGGLAGDGALFKETLVGCDGVPQRELIAAIGFYGDHCRIGHGSIGGWMPFGPERIITKSKGNVLFELDGQPALSLYKNYLGDEAKNLPASALLFPLAIRPQGAEVGLIVRTILSIDENDQSMTFAGDIPENHIAQLMHANFNHLIEGAENAASQAHFTKQNKGQFAILISCIGRKLLMGQRIVDEIDAVQQIFGKTIPQIGFYSYGEISPHFETGVCGLHNQTMTITTVTEV